MKEINLDELEALEKAATPGPWEWQRRQSEFEELKGPGEHKVMDDGSAAGEYFPEICSLSPNGKLIPAMRNALPELIDELRAARRVVETARAFLVTATEKQKQTGWCRQLHLARIAYDRNNRGVTK